MATAAMAYGERRFGAAYTARIIVVLVVFGFLAGMGASQDDPRVTAHPTLMWISVALVLAGIGVWIALGKSAVVISDSGVRRESLFGQQEVAWSQIAETRYQVVPINVYAHFGLIGALIAMTSKKSARAHLTLELIDRDRKKLKVTSNYQHADEAIGMILSRLLPPMVQNVKSNVQRGETVQFGDLGLSATAVIWKGNSIPITEITKAELAGSNLQLKRQGKWLSAVSVRSNKVPDVLVFLEVLESLAPQIKSMGVDPLARVRM
jgi:Bacterial PH domain